MQHQIKKAFWNWLKVTFFIRSVTSGHVRDLIHWNSPLCSSTVYQKFIRLVYKSRMFFQCFLFIENSRCLLKELGRKFSTISAMLFIGHLFILKRLIINSCAFFRLDIYCTKRFAVKFQGESLETFFTYDSILWSKSSI